MVDQTRIMHCWATVESWNFGECIYTSIKTNFVRTPVFSYSTTYSVDICVLCYRDCLPVLVSCCLEVVTVVRAQSTKILSPPIQHERYPCLRRDFPDKHLQRAPPPHAIHGLKILSVKNVEFVAALLLKRSKTSGRRPQDRPLRRS